VNSHRVQEIRQILLLLIGDLDVPPGGAGTIIVMGRDG
jgi:hypothetical protein